MDGGVYRGQWRGGKKEGLGVYTYPSGARYEGQWKNNLKNGLGSYHFPKVAWSMLGCQPMLLHRLQSVSPPGCNTYRNVFRFKVHSCLQRNHKIGNNITTRRATWGGQELCQLNWKCILSLHTLPCKDSSHRSQGGWYEGEWRDGQRHGPGLRIKSSGAVQVHIHKAFSAVFIGHALVCSWRKWEKSFSWPETTPVEFSSRTTGTLKYKIQIDMHEHAEQTQSNKRPKHTSFNNSTGHAICGAKEQAWLILSYPWDNCIMQNSATQGIISIMMTPSKEGLTISKEGLTTSKTSSRYLSWNSDSGAKWQNFEYFHSESLSPWNDQYADAAIGRDLARSRAHTGENSRWLRLHKQFSTWNGSSCQEAGLCHISLYISEMSTAWSKYPHPRPPHIEAECR